MFKELIIKDLKAAVKELGFESSDIVLSISENDEFGDYTTNVALQLSNQKKEKKYQSPLMIANLILEQLRHPIYLERIEVAGPGFINFWVKDDRLAQVLDEDLLKPATTTKVPKRVLIEYASPNAAKPFHIGHLRNISVGESLSRLVEFEGAEVFRANYTSDIGLPIAKTIYGVQKLKDQYEAIKDKSLKEKAEFLGKAYVTGNDSFENDKPATSEINEINKKIYDRESNITKLWLEIRDWSEAYLETIYQRLGSEFDCLIWESDVDQEGKRIVEKSIGSIFVKDDGAVIFPGENYGLHNRVFITSQGFPTYEAKELGVTIKEAEKFPFDIALHIVGPEQTDYFKVVIKAIELIDSRMIGKKRHISYGMVQLSSGKMSSRKGNVVLADDLIDQVKEEVAKVVEGSNFPSKAQTIEQVAIGAIKFFILKYDLNSDIKFDIESSVSLNGDSGPYVQYTYARTQSLLEKASHPALVSSRKSVKKLELEDPERAVLRQIEYFKSYADKASENLSPNLICEYLLNLAKAFNLFYQSCPIIGSTQEEFRVKLTQKVNSTLELGLYLLGIQAPKRM